MNNNALGIFVFAVFALILAIGGFVYVDKHRDSHVYPQPQIIRETIQVPAPRPERPYPQQPQFQPSNSSQNRAMYLEGYEDGFQRRRPCHVENYYYMRGYNDGKCHHDQHHHHSPGIGLDIHIK